jgi:hypothetical protein
MAIQSYAPRVAVCNSSGSVMFHAHAALAARLVREGAAVSSRGKRIREIVLVAGGPDDSAARSRGGNPQKYTYLEPLGCPVRAHCYSHKPHLAQVENRSIFRAALLECLSHAQ